MVESETAALVRRFAAGDHEAFAALHRRLWPRLYLWCTLRVPRALWHRLDPEDVLQEAWLRAVVALPRYEPQRAGFRTWLFAIAANVLAEQLRRLHVRDREGPAADESMASIPADVTSVVRQVVRSEELKRFGRELEALPGDDRQIMVLRGLEGLPHAEVGARLRITAAAAEIRWRRLLERFRERLQEVGLGAE
jgi:RNA polymerase sigma-70 factor (ECF subfamily)